MWVPLVILAVFAFGIGWPMWGLTNLLEQARPAGTVETVTGAVIWPSVVHPAEHLSHEGAVAPLVAFGTALLGFLIATAIYAWHWLDPEKVRRAVGPVYTFLWHKWYFDEIYNVLLVQPLLFFSRRVSDFDKQVIDRMIDGCALAVRGISTIDDAIDRWIVDGLVNRLARVVHSVGLSLRRVQTGRLRQYVVLIVVGTVALFILISFFRSSMAG